MKWFLIIAGVAFVGYILFAARFKRWPFGAKVIGTIRPTYGQQAIIAKLTHQTVRPDFPIVFSELPLTVEVIDGITDAFAERIIAAHLKSWTKGLDPERYTLYVFPSVRDVDLDGNYSPVFQVFLPPGSPYIGSEYDHGGWIYAAEQCLTDGNGNLTNQFVIAANNSRAYTARATSYGLDHLFLWHNDRAEYERTKDHSHGGQHPLW